MTLADEIKAWRAAVFADLRKEWDAARTRAQRLVANHRIERACALTDADVVERLRHERALELCKRTAKLAAVVDCAARNGRRVAIVSAVQP